MDMYLQTCWFVLPLPPSEEPWEKRSKSISPEVTNLLMTEDWVALGISGKGVVGMWTVLERDKEGMPDLIGFENAAGLVTTYNTNTGSD